MKIICTSDLHGHLSEIPPCDLLLIAGDICPSNDHSINYQSVWLEKYFKDWINNIPAEQIIMIWGNHDFIGQKRPIINDVIKDVYGCHVLIDNYCTYEGLKIWGSPWTREFFNWAFMKTATELAEVHKNIPPDTDIILTHGPPYGLCDTTPNMNHVGSPELTKHIINYQPKLVVCGHIHCAAQTRKLGDTIIANVSHVDEGYRPFLPPQEFNL